MDTYTNRAQKNKGAGGLIAICALALAVLIGGYLYFTGKANPPAPPEINEEAPVSSVVQRLAVALSEQNKSQEIGTVIFTDVVGKTRVMLKVSGGESSGQQPAHVHTGTCSEIGGIAHPLTDVQNGVSETTLDISIDELLKKLPLAINVHKSSEEANIYVSCGDVRAPITLDIEVMTMMAQQGPSSDTKIKKLDKASLAAAALAQGSLEYSGLLDDVTDGSALQGTTTTEGLANGTAQAAFTKGTYRLEAVIKNLPDPDGTDFYEGWLVRKTTPFDFISTGRFNKVGLTYVNKYNSGSDLTNHLLYIVTLEADDKNPAPSAHILEGTLAKLSAEASTTQSTTAP